MKMNMGNKQSETKLIKAVLKWRESWCDQKDLIEAENGCDCIMCDLIRACNEYNAIKQNNDIENDKAILRN